MGVATKYGFGHLVDRFKLHPLRSVTDRVAKTQAVHPELSDPERLRLMFEELGPTYIKLGQILSTKEDLLPKEYVKELEKLQDDVPPFGYDDVCNIIAEEFGTPIDEMFETFSREPVASASLGQAHIATLSGGRKVAVKVQRPGIKEVIDSDLRILRDLARFAKRHIKEAKSFDPVGFVTEFERNLRAELDYTLEAQSTEEFRETFSCDTVHVPAICWDHTSQRVMTMEFIDGIKITDIEAIDAAGLERTTLSRNFANSFLKQVFFCGMFHADPHPGNVFAMEGNVVAFIDFGMIGYLDRETRADLVEFFIAVAGNDAGAVIKVIESMGIINYDEIDVMQFRFEISNLIHKYYGRSLRNTNTGEMMREMLQLAMKYHGTVPPSLMMLSKALMTEEGICAQLDPDYNLQELAKPYIKKLTQKRMAPKEMLQEWVRMMPGLGRFVRALPDKIDRALMRVDAGTLHIAFDKDVPHHIVSEFNLMSKRISASLIVAAFIVAAALITHSRVGPHVYNVPLIGSTAFTVAGLLGVWLVYSLVKPRS